MNWSWAGKNMEELLAQSNLELPSFISPTIQAIEKELE